MKYKVFKVLKLIQTLKKNRYNHYVLLCVVKAQNFHIIDC